MITHGHSPDGFGSITRAWIADTTEQGHAEGQGRQSSSLFLETPEEIAAYQRILRKLDWKS